MPNFGSHQFEWDYFAMVVIIAIAKVLIERLDRKK